MGRVFSRYILYCGITSTLALFGLAPRLWAASTVLVSVSSSGVQGNGDSPCSAITPDGRYVAFCSSASNLVTGDANGRQDVFVRDFVAGTTECVSISSGGAQGNQDSAYPPASPSGFVSISSDGRYVAFSSNASNLVTGDTNGCRDVFVRDRTAHTTEIASIPTGGGQGNGDCEYPVISSDGRYVAFVSFASNLVAGDTNGCKDVFVRDRLAGTTERVSISSGGAQGNGECSYPAISADGRYVAFGSSASNLVAGDTSGRQDIFVRDRTASTTERVSVSTGGTQGNGDSWWPGITPDGRCVAYESAASNLVAGDTNGCEDVFVRDRTAGTTEIASIPTGGGQGNNNSAYYGPVSLSSDGRCVAFQSYASNLVTGDTNGYEDIFLRDRLAGKTDLVSISTGGTQGNNHSFNPCMSGTGRFVGFSSRATNLIAGGGNGYSQVYVNDRGAGPALTVTKAATGPSVQLGQWITYNFAVKPSLADATGVVLRDPLPANTIFSSKDGGENASWTQDGSTLRRSLGTISAETTAKASLKLKVPATVLVGTIISNTAYVDCYQNGQPRTYTSNTTKTGVIRGGGPPMPRTDAIAVFQIDTNPDLSVGGDWLAKVNIKGQGSGPIVLKTIVDGQQVGPAKTVQMSNGVANNERLILPDTEIGEHTLNIEAVAANVVRSPDIKVVMTGYSPAIHGVCFDNSAIISHVPLIGDIGGYCVGMSYASLEYYLRVGVESIWADETLLRTFIFEEQLRATLSGLFVSAMNQLSSVLGSEVGAHNKRQYDFLRQKLVAGTPWPMALAEAPVNLTNRLEGHCILAYCLFEYQYLGAPRCTVGIYDPNLGSQTAAANNTRPNVQISMYDSGGDNWQIHPEWNLEGTSLCQSSYYWRYNVFGHMPWPF